ncbi:MAG TPA: CPBP family intramembrane glutamic endopeptidase [Polyangiaceae bacterium]
MQPAPPRDAASSPAIWPLGVAYVVAFVLALGASAAYIVLAVLPRARGDAAAVARDAARFALTAPGILGSAVIDAAALALVTGVAASILRTARDVPRIRAIREDLRLGPTGARWPGLAAAMVGLVGVSLACGAIADLAGVGDTGVMAQIARVLADSSPLRIALALLTIAVAPAIAEECFFRGLVQTRVGRRWGRWPAIVASAFAFGLFHVDPVQGSLAFVAGIYLGWVVERFGGIRPGIAAHAVNNAVFVLLASFSATGEHPTRRESIVVAAAGAAVVVGAIAVLRKARWVEAPLRASTLAS